jgi:protein-tyrosine-phosphatase
MKQHILFVCVGNRVRSVFGEFYLRDIFSKRGEDIKVSSAGFVPQALKEQLAEHNIPSPNPFFNRPMAELTETVLIDKGFHVPEDWRSKELTLQMIAESDLIITALPEQKEDILRLYEETHGKVFTLKDLSNKNDSLFYEDLSVLPFDDSFWDYVEGDPEYVSKILDTWEETLIRAIPNIMEKLGNSNKDA